jgi:transcriptional regulator with XRE-family HTH domain
MLCIPEAPIKGRMADPRDSTRAWLKSILASTGWTATELSRRAHLSQTTLTRFLNDPEYSNDLSRRTIQAIAHAAQVPQPGFVPERSRARGFSDSDAVHYSAESSKDAAISRMIQGLTSQNGIDPWVMKTRALEHAGYLPDDILIIDLNASPVTRDAVCAQIYDASGTRAETIMRIWQPPYLIGFSSDEAFQRPILLDNPDMISIRGVIIASIRPRRGHMNLH